MSETAIITAIKAKMGYTYEPAPSCEKCIHCHEDEDHGLWRSTCRLNPAFPFIVEARGRCNHFTKKEIKP